MAPIDNTDTSDLTFDIYTFLSHTKSLIVKKIIIIIERNCLFVIKLSDSYLVAEFTGPKNKWLQKFYQF